MGLDVVVRASLLVGKASNTPLECQTGSGCCLVWREGVLSQGDYSTATGDPALFTSQSLTWKLTCQSLCEEDLGPGGWGLLKSFEI